jgi:predicted N-acetyltransferase YhbS
MTFDAPGGTPPEGRSRVTSDIQPYRDVVRFAVTHENLADDNALGLAAAPLLNDHERRRVRIGGRGDGAGLSAAAKSPHQRCA